jgi:protocatechuate 3,4-dioxygenase beta subunit
MKSAVQVVFSTLIAALVPGTAFGQAQSREPVQSVRISGRVTDATGAPIRDVAVKLKLAKSSDTTGSTKTNEAGEFNFLAVAARSYELYFLLARIQARGTGDDC